MGWTPLVPSGGPPPGGDKGKKAVGKARDDGLGSAPLSDDWKTIIGEETLNPEP